MQANTTIAIIGASGNMGSSIAKGLAKGAYRLLLCANDLSKVQTVVNEIKSNHAATDIEAIDCTKNASWEADIIILAVPYAAEKELAQKIKEVANQKIVISIANPLNEAYNGLVTPPDSSAAEELQKLLPHSKVVKAFNTTFAADFAQPIIDGKQVDAFIAGNDESAVNTVSELVKTVGFNPIIAGDLSVSGTLERMQLLLIQLTMKYNYNWLAGWKILHNS
ncbi:MAG: NAD(P)-binding domain-containing protein [Flavisolibacter sp.]|nr:NAD(P)-binding domain-containing protein [Flavisolibacter sp.]MBD0365392.1 NAD(P)-binding domain-containing protein [Flavisolibacter sp.]MBD0374075.1 NAD(P)-binding domain-containing protein [Flavisolibacter sp.]